MVSIFLPLIISFFSSITIFIFYYIQVIYPLLLFDQSPPFISLFLRLSHSIYYPPIRPCAAYIDCSAWRWLRWIPIFSPFFWPKRLSGPLFSCLFGGHFSTVLIEFLAPCVSGAFPHCTPEALHFSFKTVTHWHNPRHMDTRVWKILISGQGKQVQKMICVKKILFEFILHQIFYLLSLTYDEWTMWVINEHLHIAIYILHILPLKLVKFCTTAMTVKYIFFEDD